MNKSIRKHREIMKKERNIYVKLFNVIFNSGIYTRTVTSLIFTNQTEVIRKKSFSLVFKIDVNNLPKQLIMVIGLKKMDLLYFLYFCKLE
jgi:hypothetical protein